MNRVIIRDEVFFSLDILAECYEVEVSWLREAYDCGLLGQGEEVKGELLIQARMVERVALIRRFNRHVGVDFERISVLLAGDEGWG